MNKRTICILAAVLLVVASASVVKAGDAQIWPGDPWPIDKPLPEREYGYRFVDRESFSQSWFILIDIADGGTISVSILTSNIGLGDNLCGVELNYIDPAGKAHFVRGETDPKQLNAAGDKFSVRIGANSLSGTYPNFALKVAEGNITADLKFKVLLPPWRPNGGKCYFSADRKDYYFFTVPMPAAEVSGTLTLDGRPRKISGRAYMDYSGATVLPYKYADRWQGLRSLGAEYTIDSVEFRLPAELGGGTVAWMIVGQGNRIVMASSAARLKPSEWSKDPVTGKDRPQRVDFEASGNGCSIKGTVRADKLIEYVDILAKLSPFERTVAGLVAKSHLWRYRSSFSAVLTLADGTQQKIEQSGISEIMYVGK